MADSWAPDIAGTAGPKYKAVTAAIAAAVARGELGHGDRLPPQRDNCSAARHRPHHRHQGL